jgi:hypothetical protein
MVSNDKDENDQVVLIYPISDKQVTYIYGHHTCQSGTHKIALASVSSD